MVKLSKFSTHLTFFQGSGPRKYFVRTIENRKMGRSHAQVKLEQKLLRKLRKLHRKNIPVTKLFIQEKALSLINAKAKKKFGGLKVRFMFIFMKLNDNFRQHIPNENISIFDQYLG